MKRYSYELTRCWTYAYGQFTAQAHRLSLRTSLAPREARNAIARLHGLGTWQTLTQTLLDLHDIGYALALDIEHGHEEAAFRAGVFAQVERLASLKRPVHLQALSQSLRPKYRGVKSIPDIDEEGMSDTEMEAWGQYEEIKWEMAYRTLWDRNGANSASVQNIGIELAERLAAWYPALAPNVEAALRIVFDFYGCRAESRGLNSCGPISEYFGTEQSRFRRVSEICEQVWNRAMPWRSASKLWNALTFAAPAELDGVYENYPVLALLPHAPRDTYVQLHVGKDGTAGLWCDTLVPDASSLAQLAFLGGGSALQVSVVDVSTARDELDAPDKAGWLKVTWNM